MKKIDCIIIDDEPSSQRVLEKFIEDVDFLRLCQKCSNAISAIQCLRENPEIELLFLDINMPKISGISFYKSLTNPPKVIFTTAYPEYAIEGFEVNATDYLLKPFSFERFLSAVNKVTEGTNNSNRLKDYGDILIKCNKVLHKLAVKDIIFIEAFGDYVKIYVDEQTLITNSTFSKILDVLPQELFERTHKSFAVNLSMVERVEGNIVHNKNHKIPLGQKFKSNFMESLTRFAKN